MSETEVVKLAGHEKLETITDREGFVWCISPDGQNAALLVAPANLKGSYNWASSQALGQHVNLSMPASAYANIRNGPQFFEIYHYLTSRHRYGYTEAPTDSMPVLPFDYAAAQRAGALSTHKTVVTAFE